MIITSNQLRSLVFALLCLAVPRAAGYAADEWPQLKGDAQRSGNAFDASLDMPLGLVAAIPLTDAVFASPVVSQGKVIVLDGSGVVTAIDTKTLGIAWRFSTRGGPGNCNNMSAPAVVGRFVHVGTMAGYYYVIDIDTGNVVREIDSPSQYSLHRLSANTVFISLRLAPRSTPSNQTAKLPGRGTSSKRLLDLTGIGGRVNNGSPFAVIA